MRELLRASFQGLVAGRTVDLYRQRNRHGMTVRISNFGARIQQVLVPDHHGQMADVVLGYDSLAGVQQDTSWLGAFVGRYPNRIGGARLTLNGQQDALS
jgi:aldose 1-epimerase